MARWVKCLGIAALCGCSVLSALSGTALDGSYIGQTKLTQGNCGDPNCASAFDFIWTVSNDTSGYVVHVGDAVQLQAGTDATGGSLIFSYTQRIPRYDCTQASDFNVTLSPNGTTIGGSLLLTETPACDGHGTATCQCSYTLSGTFTPTPTAAVVVSDANYRE